MKIVFVFFLFSFISPLVCAQWSMQNQGATGKTLYSICFPDVNTGYAAGENGTLLKTIDAGATWVELSSGTNMYLESVYFINADTGIAVGASQDGGIILKTIDGGDTWSIRNFSTGSWYVKVHFSDANNGFVAGSVLYGDEGVILKTTDGGTSWGAIYSSVNELNSCYFLDSLTGYAVGEIGTILKTVDGGISWTSSNPTFGNLYDVRFTSSSTGYAAGIVLLKTTDSGATWSVLPKANVKSGELLSIFFTSESKGYAVGVGGTILMTSNAGASWVLSESGTNQDLHSVFFADENTGYAAGAGGTILKTTNAGALGIHKKDLPVSGFTLFPNPATSKILLSGLDASDQTVVSISASGGKILLQNLYSNQEQIEIDVSVFSAGLYILKLQTGKGVEAKKLIIR